MRRRKNEERRTKKELMMKELDEKGKERVRKIIIKITLKIK